MRHASAAVWGLLALVLVSGVLRAQTDDVFAFIPSGGKTLLSEIVRGAPADEVRDLLTGRRDRDGWRDHLVSRGPALAGVQKISEQELFTLAAYLSFNMPLADKSVPANPARANWQKVLPPDGRDLVMENCQFCHIITVVVTQEKSQDAWLGTMNSPSHIEIELTPRQREALASYLVLNAAIPIDLVPEALRAGGASY